MNNVRNDSLWNNIVFEKEVIAHNDFFFFWFWNKNFETEAFLRNLKVHKLVQQGCFPFTFFLQLQRPIEATPKKQNLWWHIYYISTFSARLTKNRHISSLFKLFMECLVKAVSWWFCFSFVRKLLFSEAEVFLKCFDVILIQLSHK